MKKMRNKCFIMLYTEFNQFKRFFFLHSIMMHGTDCSFEIIMKKKNISLMRKINTREKNV
jgi:hypothetical protein